MTSAQSLPIKTIPYNETLAKYLTLHSAAAYTNHPDNCHNAVPSSFQVLNTFSAKYLDTPIFGYIGVDKVASLIVVAYRGSVNAIQLVQELAVSTPTPYNGLPGVKVLRYFLDAATLLGNQTRAAVSNLVQLFPHYQIAITGHSLGGSIATLAALDLVLTNSTMGRSPLLYTQGEPRTGNYELSLAVKQYIPNSYRVVHFQDLVAHLPPCNTTFDVRKLAFVCQPNDPARGGFWSYHHGTEVWYPQEDMPDVKSTQAGAYAVCAGTPAGEDSTCSDSLSFPTSIDNHKTYFRIGVGTFCPESVMNVNPFPSPING